MQGWLVCVCVGVGGGGGGRGLLGSIAFLYFLARCSDAVRASIGKQLQALASMLR